MVGRQSVCSPDAFGRVDKGGSSTEFGERSAYLVYGGGRQFGHSKFGAFAEVMGLRFAVARFV